MRFVWLLLGVFGILMAVGYLAFRRDGWYLKTGYPVASLGGMIVLAVVSIFLRVREEVRLVTAANCVQAMGIFGLVLGLALVVGTYDVSNTDMKVVGATIFEGLISAGLGALLGTTLKVVEEHAFGAKGTAAATVSTAAASSMSSLGLDPTALTGVAAAMETLKNELEASHGAAIALQGDFKTLRTILEEMGKLLVSMNSFFLEASRIGSGKGAPHA
ncbi:MAG: hypothetical protein V1821_02975 [bacterium]